MSYNLCEKLQSCFPYSLERKFYAWVRVLTGIQFLRLHPLPFSFLKHTVKMDVVAAAVARGVQWTHARGSIKAEKVQ